MLLCFRSLGIGVYVAKVVVVRNQLHDGRAAMCGEMKLLKMHLVDGDHGWRGFILEDAKRKSRVRIDDPQKHERKSN